VWVSSFASFVWFLILCFPGFVYFVLFFLAVGFWVVGGVCGVGGLGCCVVLGIFRCLG